MSVTEIIRSNLCSWNDFNFKLLSHEVHIYLFDTYTKYENVRLLDDKNVSVKVCTETKKKKKKKWKQQKKKKNEKYIKNAVSRLYSSANFVQLRLDRRPRRRRHDVFFVIT